jgi:hypothetical protein
LTANVRATLPLLLAATALVGGCGQTKKTTASEPARPYAQVVTCMRLTDAVFLPPPSRDRAGVFIFGTPDSSIGESVVIANGPGAADRVDAAASRLPAGPTTKSASRGPIVFRVLGPLTRRGTHPKQSAVLALDLHARGALSRCLRPG